MRWMVDFAEAEKVGMGIRVALTARAARALLVFGVKTALTPDGAATRLEALLDAHHYTRGLALLAAGTPTNNTAEAEAGYTQRDDGRLQRRGRAAEDRQRHRLRRDRAAGRHPP